MPKFTNYQCMNDIDGVLACEYDRTGYRCSTEEYSKDIYFKSVKEISGGFEYSAKIRRSPSGGGAHYEYPCGTGKYATAFLHVNSETEDGTAKCDYICTIKNGPYQRRTWDIKCEAGRSNKNCSQIDKGSKYDLYFEME